MNVYPFIEAEKAQQRSVKRACGLLKVSRAAYYAARDGQPCDRDREDARLTVLIKAEHKRSRAGTARRGSVPGCAAKGNHHQSAGGRLAAQRLPAVLIPASLGAAARSRHPSPPDNQHHHPALAAEAARVQRGQLQSARFFGELDQAKAAPTAAIRAACPCATSAR